MEDPSYLNARIESLFSFADAYASKIAPNERYRCLAWLADPNTSAAKRFKITENIQWTDQIFQEYYRRKNDLITNGASVDGDFSSFGDPPYTFKEILDTP